MTSSQDILKFVNHKIGLDLDGYKCLGGFEGFKRALELRPSEVIDEVIDSKLKGRGGAGFDTGLKWASMPKNNEVKYLVVNADEGEPGTFKDRYIIDNCPFLLLEGLLIAAYAISANKAFIYVRGEYQHEVNELQDAIALLKWNNLLGDNILDSEFSIDVEIKRGAGSYVVGDETALLNSLMGNRGNPLLKPPYPTQKGLWGKATLVNNVETLACVPIIMTNGSEAFRNIGSKDCPGPKLFSLSGQIANPGIYEFPMGAKVSDLLLASGGMEGTFKAVQIGGTAGAIYGPQALDYKLDYSFMKKCGSGLGSGALVFMNDTVSMVEVLDIIVRFYADESCGKCMPCRFGTKQLKHIASKIIKGGGSKKDLVKMKNIVLAMSSSSFCPFGKSIALPVLSLLDGFGAEIIND